MRDFDRTPLRLAFGVFWGRDAPSVAVSEYFVETPPDFEHRARTFRVDALPETDELVAPFVGGATPETPGERIGLTKAAFLNSLRSFDLLAACPAVSFAL